MTPVSSTQQMRRIVAALLWLVGVTACGAEKGEKDSGTVAAGDLPASPSILVEQVAGIKIGMKFEDLAKLGQLVLDTTTRTPDGADFERAVTIAIGHDTVVAFMGSGTVGLIEISTGGLRTVEGLGVGSHVGDLLGEEGVGADVLRGNAWIEIGSLCGVYFLAAITDADVGQSLDSVSLRRLSHVPVGRVLVTGCARS
jgi:hypothetical protein